VGPDAAGQDNHASDVVRDMPPDDGEARVAGLRYSERRRNPQGKGRLSPAALRALWRPDRHRKYRLYADLYQVPRETRGERVTGSPVCQPGPFPETEGPGPLRRHETETGVDLRAHPYPQVLFLDEPTTGVDSSLTQGFWIILYDLLREGVTILFQPPTSMRLSGAAGSVSFTGETCDCGTPLCRQGADRGSILELRMEESSKRNGGS